MKLYFNCAYLFGTLMNSNFRLSSPRFVSFPRASFVTQFMFSLWYDGSVKILILCKLQLKLNSGGCSSNVCKRSTKI
jgi:hypothetical protein